MGAAFQSVERKTGQRRRSRPIADINVTPMVDVMLVLLVIFMVTAPMLTVGVPVDLPKTKAAALNEKTEPLTITVTADTKVYVQETEVDLETLVPRLQAITESKPETRIFVRGDKAVPYGQVLQVMGTLSAAGFTKVALMAELPQGKAKMSPGNNKKLPVKKN